MIWFETFLDSVQPAFILEYYVCKDTVENMSITALAFK